MNGKIGIFYGSSTGQTETAAKMIAQALSVSGSDVHDVAKAGAADLQGYDCIILGSSTWGCGDLQDDWESFIGDLEAANLRGKKVAVFGLGDQETYGDTFVDAMGAIHAAARAAGAEAVGEWPADGYTHSASRGQVNGSFVGLALDYDNQADLSAQRIAAWTAQLRKEIA